MLAVARGRRWVMLLFLAGRWSFMGSCEHAACTSRMGGDLRGKYCCCVSAIFYFVECALLVNRPLALLRIFLGKYAFYRAPTLVFLWRVQLQSSKLCQWWVSSASQSAAVG